MFCRTAQLAAAPDRDSLRESAAGEPQQSLGRLTSLHLNDTGIGIITARFAALALSALSSVAIGYSNADRLIPGIYRALPWTRGSCATWSGWAFLATFGTGAVALALAIIAKRASTDRGTLFTVSNVIVVIAAAQVAYWLVAATGNFLTQCIE